MHARPLFDNVVIEVRETPKQTTSGIHLPESMEKELAEGVIIAVGDGAELPVAIQGIGGMTTLAKQYLRVKVGEYVVYKKYTAVPFTMDGKKYVGLNQKDIITVIDK